MRPRVAGTKRGQPPGFSLLEVLTVVGIIGVLAAVGLPTVLTFVRQSQLRGSAQQVASELQSARLSAIKRNANYGVVFFVPDSASFRFFYEDKYGTVARQGFATADKGLPQTLPVTMEFVQATAGADSAVRFDRLGGMCHPGAGAGECAPAPSISPAPTANYVSYQADGTASLRLRHTITKLCLDVVVAVGGRVTLGQAVVSCP